MRICRFTRALFVVNRQSECMSKPESYRDSEMHVSQPMIHMRVLFGRINVNSLVKQFIFQSFYSVNNQNVQSPFLNFHHH